jgi:hypothetical protein
LGFGAEAGLVLDFVAASRAIPSRASARGVADEVLVTNVAPARRAISPRPLRAQPRARRKTA